MPSDSAKSFLVQDILKRLDQHLITATSRDSIRTVIARLKAKGISQVPIVDGNEQPVSIVHEVDILWALQSGKVNLDSPVATIAHPLGGVLSPTSSLEEVFRVFETDRVAVVVEDTTLVGIIAKIDVIDFLSEH